MKDPNAVEFIRMINHNTFTEVFLCRYCGANVLEFADCDISSMSIEAAAAEHIPLCTGSYPPFVRLENPCH